MKKTSRKTKKSFHTSYLARLPSCAMVILHPRKTATAESQKNGAAKLKKKKKNKTYDLWLSYCLKNNVY